MRMRKNAAIIALTGAGISKSCGIPTFQETPGLSEKLSVNFRASHPTEFRAAMDLLTRNCSGKNPTAAHRALAQYQIPIITMNIDGLHQAAGAELVLELHGSVAKNNVVLYGQQVLHVDGAIDLIVALGNYARQNALDGYLNAIRELSVSDCGSSRLVGEKHQRRRGCARAEISRQSRFVETDGVQCNGCFARRIWQTRLIGHTRAWGNCRCCMTV